MYIVNVNKLYSGSSVKELFNFLLEECDQFKDISTIEQYVVNFKPYDYFECTDWFDSIYSCWEILLLYIL